MTSYVNYFVTSKHSRLINGHIKSENLYNKILNHDGNEAYSCYFDLDESLLKFEYDTHKKDNDGKPIYQYLLNGQTPSNPDATCNGKTFTQYEGICRPALNMVSFDFDSENPEDSLKDVRRFCEWLDIDDAIVFFSGSKGFHVMVHFDYFNLEPNEYLPNQLKDLAKHLKEFFPTLDDSIYNYNRKFRVPFTKHDKSGLYKVPTDIDDDLLTIKENAQETERFKFLPEEKQRAPLEVIAEAIETSKRKTYEVEKERAGTIAKPSPFEKFDGKLCISKMLESRCEDIGRNNAALRIVNDYYRTGKTQQKCEQDLSRWATQNGLPLSEITGIITNIYERGFNYNFGCQDECKSSYCSAKCPIWKKLDPDKRPQTVDQPQSAVQSKQPSEFEVVERVLLETFSCEFNTRYRKFEGGFICKQGKRDLFFYKEGHWQHLEEEEMDLIKIKFNALYDNSLGERKIEAVFRMFMMYVPSKPKDVDMFVPRVNVANFNNGTLHLKTDSKGQYYFDFRAHDKNDFITFKIDFDYSPDLIETNEKFESWLYKYLSKDDENFKLVQEMFGASLVPAFPQLFVLHGASGTGKTTCIKILKKMHGDSDKNICKVPPHCFHGFNLESMVGRLVNIVTDINTHAKIDDDVIKQVEDRDTVRIARKNIKDIYAPLPALHIFGANKMPKTLEGYSGAMNRRWSIVNFDKVHTGEKNRNIADLLFNHNPQGVINFAVKGLMRLASENQGFFSKSTKSEKKVDEWTSQDDVIELFLTDLRTEGIEFSGEIMRVEKSVHGRVERKMFWKIFDAWQEEALGRYEQIGRNLFLQLVKDKGYSVKIIQGSRHFLGLNFIDASSHCDNSI